MNVQTLHTLLNNTREHVRFHEWQIEALAIPVSFNSAKQRRKTISICFIFIKWSSINYNLGARFAKKTATSQLSHKSSRCSQASTGIGQAPSAYLGGCVLWVYVCRALSTCAQQLCTNCFIYNYYINLLL